MTPMIDVVFQLLIFFLLVTDMARAQVENVTLPPASKSAMMKDPGIVVNVLSDGAMRVSGRPVTPEKLAWLFENQHARENGPFVVTIRADRSAPFEKIQLVMQIAADRGGEATVQLAATKEN